MDGVATRLRVDTWRREAPGAPRVSVVIPTHNRSGSLRQLLGFIERSTKPAGGMEVVVVDDGSTDGTAQVVAASSARYLRQTNSGPAAARERGWRAARGEVIVFFDDDVVPEPDAIDRLVKALEDADAVGAMIRPKDLTKLISHYMHVDGMVSHRVVDGEVVWLLVAAAAIRREALERVGGFDLSFYPAGEDVDLACRLVEAGCVLRVEPSAAVAIGCPSRLSQLVSTLYVYGGGFKMLANRHRSFKRERTRSALLRLLPGEWLDLYRAYRLEASRRRSFAFLFLHGFAALPYAAGVIAGQRTSMRGDHNGKPQVDLEEPVELVGRVREMHPALEPADQELAG